MKNKILWSVVIVVVLLLGAYLVFTGLNQMNSKTGNSEISSGDVLAPEKSTGLIKQELIRAKKYMVATANPLASDSGYQILKKGGNAIDAMVAIQTTLTLVEPQSSGLGGGAFVVYWDNRAKKLITFDARETAPKAAKPDLFLDENGEPMKFLDAVIGGRSVGTPSIPKMMEYLHKKYGKLEWKTLFDTPLTLAENGFAVSPRMADSIAHYADRLSTYPKAKEYFFPNGKALQAGYILKNKEFAETVKILAEKGSAPFYTGELAKNIVKAVREAKDNPGLLSDEDLKSYKIIERDAVCGAYREYQICGMGAPSSGAIALGQILGILNNFEPRQLQEGKIETLRILGDASRIAFKDRGTYVADPDFVKVPTKELLSPSYLKARADEIKAEDKALEEIREGNFSISYTPAKAIELPSTSHIVIVDAEGNVLSMTTSVENAFGSTLMANGYLLNNQLTDFSFTYENQGAKIANSVEPGKRPRSSMAPTIVMKQNQPYMAVGSPGGSFIIGYVAKTLLAHIDWGMDIQKAISYPNILNRFGTYELEANTPATKFEQALQNIGYKTKVRDLNSGLQGIVILPDELLGGADPRREGKVMGD